MYGIVQSISRSRSVDHRGVEVGGLLSYVEYIQSLVMMVLAEPMAESNLRAQV